MGRIARSVLVLIMLTCAVVPASAQPQGDVVETLTAEFGIRLAAQDVRRKRDVQLADDRRRQSEETADATIAALQVRMELLSARVRQARQQGAADRRLRLQAEQQLVSARRELAQASREFNAELAKRDDAYRAAIASYRDDISQIVRHASPEEVAALQRFAEGDDSAFAEIDRLTRASIRARNAAVAVENAAAAAANARDLGQLATFMEVRHQRGTATRRQAVQAWTEAIASVASNVPNRLALCRFLKTTSEPIADEAAERAQREDASATCDRLAGEVGAPADRLPFFVLMVDSEYRQDERGTRLRHYRQAIELIDTIIRDNAAPPAILADIAALASDGARAQHGLAYEAGLAERRALPRAARRARIAADSAAADATARPFYRTAEHQIDAYLRQVPPPPAGKPFWAALDRLAFAMREIDPHGAHLLHERILASTQTVLAADAQDYDARFALAKALDRLDDLAADSEDDAAGIGYVDRAIAEWRRLVAARPGTSFLRKRLADALNRRHSLLAGQDMERGLALLVEVVALRKQVADMEARDLTALDTQEDLAIAHGNLAMTYLRFGRTAESRDEYRIAVELYRQLVQRAATDPLYQAINDALYEDGLLDSLEAFATASEHLGQRAEAIAALEEALALGEALARRFPESETYGAGNKDRRARLAGLRADIGPESVP